MHSLSVLLGLAAMTTGITASPLNLGGPTGQGGARAKVTRGEDATGLQKRVNGLILNNNAWLTIGLGTPPQDMQFLTDTGANAFAVASTLLPANKRGNQILYDPSKSSTAKRLDGYTWAQFGSGVVYNESITIGGTVFNNVPLCAQDDNGGPSNDRSGNLGLDPTDQPTSPNSLPSLMHTIMGQLPKPVATLSWNYYLQEGELDLGFIDSSKYTGPMTYLNLEPGAQFWQTHCDGIVINGKLVPNTGFDTIFDHGTGDARVPRVGMDAFFSQVPGAVFNAGQETYDFPCDATLPDFTFSIGLLPIKIPGYGHKYGPVDGTSNTCRSSIKVPGDNGNSGFFGHAWLGSVFMVFDYQNNRMGLANRPAYSTNVPTLGTAGSLKLCQGTGFSGTCGNLNFQTNTCASLSGTPYYKNVGSYSPSVGYCTLYSDTACASPLGYAAGVRSPGISNTYGYKNIISAYACFQPNDYPIRSSGTLSICDNSEFTGNCQDLSWSSFACQNLPTSLNKKVISARVETGYCYMYTNRDCTGAVQDGAPFVSSVGFLDVGHKVQSFMCV